MNPSSVLVSVVVPALNEAGTLPATLASLAAQRWDGVWEVIVVDNGSEDATAEIARAAGARVVGEHRRGVCRARQAGVDAAYGQILVSTDADTVHPPDWLARIVDAFCADDEITDATAGDGRSALVAVAGPCRYREPPWWASFAPRLGFGLVDVVAGLTGRVVYLTATNVAFRRDVFPGYDVELQQGGDEVDLLRRLRGVGRLQWDRDNVVLTSSRRMREGLLHTVVVSYGWYYLGQRLWHRLRPGHLVSAAPTVRGGDAQRSAGRRRGWRVAAAAVAMLLLARRAQRGRG